MAQKHPPLQAFISCPRNDKPAKMGPLPQSQLEALPQRMYETVLPFSRSYKFRHRHLP